MVSGIGSECLGKAVAGSVTAIDVTFHPVPCRKQLIVDVREDFKLQVPRALKEHLVGQLRTFFLPKES